MAYRLPRGAVPDSLEYARWRANTRRRDVPVATVEEIEKVLRARGVGAAEFGVLDGMARFEDPDGKSFFLVAPDITGERARLAVLLTYVLNAGTGYRRAAEKDGVRNDFRETAYSAREVIRIAQRQQANRWSYAAVRSVCRAGGRMVTTPNGILLALSGNRVQNHLARRAGTMWGDIFLANIRHVADPAELLRRIVTSGRMWYADTRGGAPPYPGGLALDRLLHHEEMHARQWAAKGISGMVLGYGWEIIRENRLGGLNRIEADAGLSDGGYR